MHHIELFKITLHRHWCGVNFFFSASISLTRGFIAILTCAWKVTVFHSRLHSKFCLFLVYHYTNFTPATQTVENNLKAFTFVACSQKERKDAN